MDCLRHGELGCDEYLSDGPCLCDVMGEAGSDMELTTRLPHGVVGRQDTGFPNVLKRSPYNTTSLSCFSSLFALDLVTVETCCKIGKLCPCNWMLEENTISEDVGRVLSLGISKHVFVQSSNMVPDGILCWSDCRSRIGVDGQRKVPRRHICGVHPEEVTSIMLCSLYMLALLTSMILCSLNMFALFSAYISG